MPAAPAGYVWQPCVYQFDQTNVPALGSIALLKGQESSYIALPLDRDAPFVLLAARIADTGLNVRLTDPWGNDLMDDYVSPLLYAFDHLTVLEGPGLDVPLGAVFTVRLQGQ